MLFGTVALLGRSAAAETPAGKPANSARIEIHSDQPAKPISPVLFGIFFEDLSYAADGGLYAELVQNRSFEYSASDSPEWTQTSFWKFSATGGAGGSFVIQDANPLHTNNPHYAVVNCGNAGAGGEVALANNGFDGIAVKSGEAYDFSVFARRRPGEKGPLHVRLEAADGSVLAKAEIPELSADWQKYSATLTPARDEANARLVIAMSTRGAVYLDVVSLFPHKTFKGRPNGLRADLAQAIADLKPKFVRFPGGCLAHGDGVANIYHWKDTIGPVEQRKEAKNIWRYHQTHGLGYFEYFQFCEDIGATPLPIVAAGVSCQNSDYAHGTGQQCIPMEDMPAYIADILDLIEYANGPADSTWGAKRAAAGHPEPFHLKYLGVGNEDAITPGFTERFKMIFDALRQKHPEITVVGTVGPSPAGGDYDRGWKLAKELSIPIVDEHYYQQPNWFLKNTNRYDTYERNKTQVYVGEYASWGNTLRNALAEAVHMTSLERNGDVVHMASYAPLLCKLGQVQWYPDMVYFNNAQVFLTTNYYAQQLFSANGGDAYVPSALTLGREPEKGEAITMSSVRDSASGELIIKLVNLSASATRAAIRIDGAQGIDPEADCVVLTGDVAKTNAGDPRARGNVSADPIKPVASRVKVSPAFDYDAPAFSLTVLRLKTH